MGKKRLRGIDWIIFPDNERYRTCWTLKDMNGLKWVDAGGCVKPVLGLWYILDDDDDEWNDTLRLKLNQS